MDYVTENDLLLCLNNQFLVSLCFFGAVTANRNNFGLHVMPFSETNNPNWHEVITLHGCLSTSEDYGTYNQ